MASVTVTFSLDSEADRALVGWLDGLPRGQKSQTIRDALQAHVLGAGVTLADVYQVVKRIEHKIDKGLVVATSTAPGGNQPSDQVDDQDILGNLEGLGL